MSSELVVKDYLDISLKEIPDFLHHQEIDFSIELESGIGPIPRAPYIMDPVELKECVDLSSTSIVCQK